MEISSTKNIKKLLALLLLYPQNNLYQFSENKKTDSKQKECKPEILINIQDTFQRKL